MFNPPSRKSPINIGAEERTIKVSNFRCGGFHLTVLRHCNFCQIPRALSPRRFKKRGFSVVEVIVAMGLFVVGLTAVAVSVFGGFSSARTGDEDTRAWFFAQEGIEAVRSIKRQGWQYLIPGTYGLQPAGGSSRWTFTGTEDLNDKFLRRVTIQEVRRDGSGNIVASGGTVDPATFKVISNVTWDFTIPGQQKTMTLTTYLTHWEKTIDEDWLGPLIEARLDLPNSDTAWKVQTAGNYAYIIRKTSSSNFFVANITDPATPSISGTLSLWFNAVPENLAMSGNNAYVVSRENFLELQRVNVANPANPSVSGITLNIPWDLQASGVYVVGNNVYVGRDYSESRREFFVVDGSSSFFWMWNVKGSINLDGNAHDIVVLGNYAYVASSQDEKDMQIVKIDNPAAMSVVATVNLEGNADIIAITGFGTTVIAGRDTGEVDIINVSTPASPQVIGTYQAGTRIQDLCLGKDNKYLFLATLSSSQEFQVIDISDLANPQKLGELDLPNDLNGVAYNEVKDRVIAVGKDTAGEVLVIKPK